MTVYEPMDVTIVQDADGRGDGPEPTYDPEWSRIDGMRWSAGVIKARTGITVKFCDTHRASGPGYVYEWPQLIGVLLYGNDGWRSSHSEFDSAIDIYLRGLEDGARVSQQT